MKPYDLATSGTHGTQLKGDTGRTDIGDELFEIACLAEKPSKLVKSSWAPMNSNFLLRSMFIFLCSISDPVNQRNGVNWT